MVHVRKEENKNSLNFNGMVSFYKNVLGKIKEGRDNRIAKRNQQQEETMEVD